MNKINIYGLSIKWEVSTIRCAHLSNNVKSGDYFIFELCSIVSLYDKKKKILNFMNQQCTNIESPPKILIYLFKMDDKFVPEGWDLCVF